ncbi:[protein-PII] uridylyltransferase [Paracoccaceae bacterium]|nr:[protein-PII] uridylyltransferase [Paracoccaceae bacterium]
MRTANKTIIELNSCGEKLNKKLLNLAFPTNPDAKARAKITSIIAAANDSMNQIAFDFLNKQPFLGNEAKSIFCRKTDVLVTTVFRLVHEKFHPLINPSESQSLSLVAIGGYGRGEMAPYSDIDLLFLSPDRQTSWAKNIVESILYILWDLKFKVGYSSRTISDCVQLGLEDLTIRTSMLEKRFLCGNKGLFEDLRITLRRKVFSKKATNFVEGKLSERAQRHKKHANARYMLEPNIKEGKGGLRDLHTLYWISKYIYKTDNIHSLIEKKVFKKRELEIFTEAENFLWFIRCKIHQISGYANEKLYFNIQADLAKSLKIEDDNSRRGVEIFMQKYFLQAKNVGDLTRIFLTAIEENYLTKKKGFKRSLSELLGLSGRSIKPLQDGLIIEKGRLNIRDKKFLTEKPINILKLFICALDSKILIHPQALRLVSQNLNLVDTKLKSSFEANDLFLSLLIDYGNPERVLRRMNEVGFLGAFIPDFGRIVALMQFNMYHWFTVDEHTIQCIKILSEIERLPEEYGTAVREIFSRKSLNRKILYLAILFHDIGKGLENDHSEEGERIANKLCLRFSLKESERKKICWLVRNHLMMSDFAQKRDLSDQKTIIDFQEYVQDRDTLDLLFILTVCDIKGVSSDAWNNWKSSLLESLYFQTLQLVSTDIKVETRSERIETAKRKLEGYLQGFKQKDIKKEASRHYDAYWLVSDTATQKLIAEMIICLRQDPLQIEPSYDNERDITKIIFVMEDHPGIFSRLSGALAIASANVIDAKTFTTKDGIAIFIFWMQDNLGKTYDERKTKKLLNTVKKILSGEIITKSVLEKQDKIKDREKYFEVPTKISFDNSGSHKQTIIEVDTRDRLGLLYDITNTLFRNQIAIKSAVIATYGEQAVDTFYVNDLFGEKITSPQKLDQLKRELLFYLKKHFNKALKD